jgi:hypothetical protein
MRVLLDTNVLIHREAATVVRRDIGRLFFWLDKVKCDKCVHPLSLARVYRPKPIEADFPRAKILS